MMQNVKVDLVEDETKALLANAAQAKEIPGVDLTRMTPAQRTAAIKAMNSDNCTCGCELTIAACRINDLDVQRASLRRWRKSLWPRRSQKART